MSHDTPNPKRAAGRLYRPLAIATMIASGLLQPMLPILAAGTPAGTNISNTATATYKDDPLSTDTIDATSNTVEIEVAEIAGLTAVPSGFNDVDGGAVQAGDDLEYLFDVTNVGNAPTDIVVPQIADLTTENLDVAGIEYSIDGGLNFLPLPVNGLIPNVAPDAVVVVKVTGTPAAGARAGDPIGVTLGNTGDDDNQAGTQNQPDNNDPINTDTTPEAVDLRTQDPTPGDTTDDPVNGEREASASQSIPFASSKTPVALAQVEKVSSLAPGATPTADDDLITYGLSLEVADTSPNAAFDPQDLAGTDIDVDGVVAARILVSDAIPAGTTLQSVNPTLPAGGWVAVYTNTPTTTSAVDATWTANPANIGGIDQATRVGFVLATTLAKGTTVAPFEFTVITDGLDPSGGQVANIAQVFGTTDGDPSPTPEIVYDESGDNNPNNFNDDGTPPTETQGDPNPTGTNYDPTTDLGIADPSVNGTDPDGTNDNTGTGPDGEDNVVNIGTSAGPDELLNGPDGDPAAVGPVDNNDDYTNASSDVPAGLGPNDPIPAVDPVTFNNTVQNPNTTGFIQDVTIEPISPTQAENADESSTTGQYGTNADIPDQTTVTIFYDGGTPGNAADDQTATYTFNAGTGLFELTAGTPVNVGQMNAGDVVDYDVTVQLPPGVVTPLDEVPIPIVAFPDDDPENDGINGDPSDDANGTRGFSDETTNNITIDRVYTGFMELVKEARILDTDGTTVIEDWTQTITSEVEPDQFIEYRISYKNISSPQVGSGNVGLTAYEFEVIEDGNDIDVNTVSGADNNWATVTTHQRNTVADRGSMEYFTNSADFPATVLTTSDPLDGTKVDVYRNDVGTVAPQVEGQLQFRRQVD